MHMPSVSQKTADTDNTENRGGEMKKKKKNQRENTDVHDRQCLIASTA